MSRKINAEAFTRDAVVRLLGPGFSSEYVADYLKDLKATAILVEDHYVDRHYLDDFSAYYSKSFTPPEAPCSRLHFFDTFSAQDVDKALTRAFESKDALQASEKDLQAHYLGFLVRRPLAGAAIGRTVLKTYPAEGGRRHYGVGRRYWVNPAGLRLYVDGLAYQQQDRGAAVCASTALWVALQRVAYVAGHRSPTPSAITAAADSPFPASHGLDLNSMARALRTLGYIADVFDPAENRALFRAKVVACLESHLPVILLMTKKEETGAGHVTIAHAITVTGFSEPKTIAPIPPPFKGGPQFRFRSGSLEVLYVHDDNLGSHAHYELVDSDELNNDGHKILTLRRGRSNKPALDGWDVDLWDIQAALVPKPEELRLPVENLFLNLHWFGPLFTNEVFQEIAVHCGARFESGIDYKRALFERGFDAARLRAFMISCSLPRHVGVLTFFGPNDAVLCEVVLDVSEIERVPGQPTVLGLVAPAVPAGSIAWKRLKGVAAMLNDCPFLPAPQKK